MQKITQRGERGFTLIELLVVIAIIGILSSVVLASLNSAREKGRDGRRVSDIKQLQLALELYYDSEGEYPAALSDANLVDNGYISVIPEDPLSDDGSEPYEYSTDSNNTDYHLGANLESDGHSSLDTDADASEDWSSVDGPDDDGCSDETDRYCYDVRP